MKYNSDRQKRSPVNLGLVDLFAYSKSSKSVVTHIKIIYNLETKSCLIDADLSNKVASTEITHSLMSQIDYLINSMIDSYLMIYKTAFLNKIVFEADLDVLGVIYESIKVSCFLKTNIPKLNVNGWDVLNTALEATVRAEIAEVIDRPATSLEMTMKRKKLRNFKIIFDYSLKDEDSTFYGKSFSHAFMSTLRYILHDYCSYEGSHQVSCNLQFSLKKRSNLIFEFGNIYPTIKLHSFSRQFSPQEAKFVIMQLNQIFDLVPNSRIYSLKLTRHTNGVYITNFGLAACNESSMFDVDLRTSEALARTFTQIVENYSLPSFYQEWTNTIEVSLENEGNRWFVDLSKYRLTHPFRSKMETLGTKNLLEKAYSEVNGVASIGSFTVVQNDNTIEELNLSVTDLGKQVSSEKVQPMQLKVFERANTKNKKLFYNFKYSSNGYYLDSERYLGWSHL